MTTPASFPGPMRHATTNDRQRTTIDGSDRSEGLADAAPPFRIGAPILRAALAAGKLPLGDLRLTILQALDAELRREGHGPAARRACREQASRFLADHAHRRSLPSADEIPGWLAAPASRSGLSPEEAAARRRSIRLLYRRVFGRSAAVPASALTE